MTYGGWGRLTRGVLAVLCVLTAPAVPTWGDDFMSAIRSRLSNPEVVRGEFEQKKVIEALGKPLVSKGHFVFVRDRGVIWHTRTPFAQTVHLTRAGLTQEQEGHVVLRLSANREPTIGAMSEIMLPLFSAEFQRLERYFHISGEAKGESWRVVLDPIPTALAQVFRQIRLDGAHHIQRVELLEANGDLTEIRFSRVQTGNAVTSEEEQLLQ